MRGDRGAWIRARAVFAAGPLLFTSLGPALAAAMTTAEETSREDVDTLRGVGEYEPAVNMYVSWVN